MEADIATEKSLNDGGTHTAVPTVGYSIARKKLAPVGPSKARKAVAKIVVKTKLTLATGSTKPTQAGVSTPASAGSKGKNIRLDFVYSKTTLKSKLGVKAMEQFLLAQGENLGNFSTQALKRLSKPMSRSEALAKRVIELQEAYYEQSNSQRKPIVSSTISEGAAAWSVTSDSSDAEASIKRTRDEYDEDDHRHNTTSAKKCKLRGTPSMSHMKASRKRAREDDDEDHVSDRSFTKKPRHGFESEQQQEEEEGGHIVTLYYGDESPPRTWCGGRGKQPPPDWNPTPSDNEASYNENKENQDDDDRPVARYQRLESPPMAPWGGRGKTIWPITVTDDEAGESDSGDDLSDGEIQDELSDDGVQDERCSRAPSPPQEATVPPQENSGDNVADWSTASLKALYHGNSGLPLPTTRQ